LELRAGLYGWCWQLVLPYHLQSKRNQKLERVPCSAKSMIFRIFGDARVAILGFLSKHNQEMRFSWVYPRRNVGCPWW